MSLEERILLNSTILDQTERKKLERDLFIEDYSLENAAIAAFRIREKDGVIEWVNKTACSKLGYSKEELTGMTIFDIDPVFTRDSWRIHRRRVRDTGAVTIESTHRSRDGSLFPVEVTVTYFTYGRRKRSSTKSTTGCGTIYLSSTVSYFCSSIIFRTPKTRKGDSEKPPTVSSLWG